MSEHTSSHPQLPARLAERLLLAPSLLPSLLALTEAASELLLTHYNNADGIEVERKADQSPITAADRAAHALIAGTLAELTPDIPVLSEESTSAEIAERREWPACWVVDPLDGTKEFIGRTGEFTINIALIFEHRPVLGIIAVPCQGTCYLGVPNVGAWLCSGAGLAISRPLVPSEWRHEEPVRVLASERHDPQRVAAVMAKLSPAASTLERVNAGSAIKFCALVDGDAELYPRTSPCYEWDVAAGDALVTAVGGFLVDANGDCLQYNARSGLLVNYFVAGVRPYRTMADLLH